MYIKQTMIALVLILMTGHALAQLDQFQAGTAIKDFGKIAMVPGSEKIPENTNFKISFDVYKQAEFGAINRRP